MEGVGDLTRTAQICHTPLHPLHKVWVLSRCHIVHERMIFLGIGTWIFCCKCHLSPHKTLGNIWSRRRWQVTTRREIVEIKTKPGPWFAVLWPRFSSDFSDRSSYLALQAGFTAWRAFFNARVDNRTVIEDVSSELLISMIPWPLGM